MAGPVLSRRMIGLIISVESIAIVAINAGLNPPQVAAISILALLLAGTVFFWRFRVAFAFIALAGLLGLGLLDVPTLIQFAGFDVILFLAAMMVVVGFLEEHRFFEQVVDAGVHAARGNAHRLIAALMLLAGFSAALVDEVTSILIVGAAVLHLTGRYRVDPVPFIMLMVFATNIGSSATALGNPVGVMIALRAGLTFSDFLRWATPIAAAVLVFAIPLAFRIFGHDIAQLQMALERAPILAAPLIVGHRGGSASMSSGPSNNGLLNQYSGQNGTNWRGLLFAPELRTSWLLLCLTLLGLVLHAPMEVALGLRKNTMLLGVAFAAAGGALLLEGDGARHLVQRRLDCGPSPSSSCSLLPWAPSALWESRNSWRER